MSIGSSSLQTVQGANQALGLQTLCLQSHAMFNPKLGYTHFHLKMNESQIC